MSSHVEERTHVEVQWGTAADEFAAEYDNGPTQFPDFIVMGTQTVQQYRNLPYQGWAPVGIPNKSDIWKPYQLRNGEFVDMSQDDGFVRLIKTS